jgi:nicotinate-nucleotide adenylyltransferase
LGGNGFVSAEAARPRRIGIFGGSFDPPHSAHLALAQLALKSLELDELRWIPAGQPWQKDHRRVAAAEHRSAMVELLIAGQPGHCLDRRELQRPGPSYSVVTAAELRAEFPAAELFLIVGADPLAGLTKWMRWRDLVGGVTLAVAEREGQAPQPAPELLAAAPSIVALALPRIDCSSTEIRSRIARGVDISGLVGDAVARYIAQHSLYPEQSNAKSTEKTRN